MTLPLYRLGRTDWAEAQIVYHALARLGRPALCLTWPDRPHVSIGFGQDARLELDLDHLAQAGRPVFKREVGGGAVYLDERQCFYQLILPLDHPAVCLDRERFYRRALAPVMAVLGRLGLAAEFRPINDIVVAGRKVSGVGAGEIGPCAVVVGNLLLSFDHAAMARALRLPDDRFRARVEAAMRENLGTLEELLGPAVPDHQTLCDLLTEEFSARFGPLSPAMPDDALRDEMARLGRVMLDQAWLLGRGRRHLDRPVKIRAGLWLVSRQVSTSRGWLRADYALREGRLGDIEFSGPAAEADRGFLEGLARDLDGLSPEDLARRPPEFPPEDDRPSARLARAARQALSRRSPG